MALSGLPFEVRPGCGEETVRAREPEEVVKELSRGKALEALACAADGDLVIGADTVVALDGNVLGKPADEADAYSMLKRGPGRGHQGCTGGAPIKKGRDETYTFAEATVVHVLPMDDREIREYIRTGEPMDKAGAYGIQGRFAVYVERIEGDYQNVVGLPLAKLYRCLKGYREELQ